MDSPAVNEVCCELSLSIPFGPGTCRPMSLELIATPIGDAGDITLRAIESLKAADVVIGEERKEVSKLLKSLGIEGKRLELLNEHSKDEDVAELALLCRTLRVALVTDCGTPGFCDPGSRLVALCRAQGQAAARPLPGASSLMCLLSVSGRYLSEFLFRGFIPVEREARALALTEVSREKRPVILMDTPYRMGRLLSELAERMPSRRVLIGCDFTQENETVIEATAAELPALLGDRKAEFILALFPGEAALPARASVGAGGGAGAVERSNRTSSRPERPNSGGGGPSQPAGSSRPGGGSSRPGGAGPKPGRKFTPGRRK